ncbi:MAG TPA: glycosyl hydrolase [Clostridiales bacterium]|nr:glycosyl hydrolase [Clostridiales bacterium]
MNELSIKKLISLMTLEEKAGLCSGADFWHTKAIDRLGIPQLMFSDGPHGLRKQDDQGDHLGMSDSIPAVCFPAGCAVAAGFDRELTRLLGRTLGNECQAEGVGVILGPAVNIKRSPLCGRNFEYYSEDPFLASELAGAFIDGVQSQHVGTSIKHFFANNQEYRRNTVSAEVKERALREIYLAAFEGAVREHQPWTVMSAYNRVNGIYAGENRAYLTDVLRGEWGFEGFVVSDWGAVNERVPALAAGLDLEMPSSNGENDALIIAAVREGRLTEQTVDAACLRILEKIYRFAENRNHQAIFDREADHAIARRIAEECIVLLKNESAVLPLASDTKVALIGEFARKPRYQGGGSSHINSSKVDTAYEFLKDKPGLTFALGYSLDSDCPDQQLIAEAVEAARTADVAVIFAGLPDNMESEGYDRRHMRLPDCQNKLIAAVTQVQSKTVVVLHNGSPVEMPWIDQVQGIIEAYLGGQAIGSAVADILYGKVNPSGRLPETFPLRLEDNPSYIGFPGNRRTVEYHEGIFVGYRWYETRKMKVLFPFGFGLSYTTFTYANLRLDKSAMTDQEILSVQVSVTNSGLISGKEVVQLYVAPVASREVRPVRELRGFSKIFLTPGETQTVRFNLGKRAFAYWENEIGDWLTESGEYQIEISRSVSEIILHDKIRLTSTTVIPSIFTYNSTLGDLMENPKSAAIVGEMFAGMAGDASSAAESQSAISSEMMAAVADAMPLRNLISFIPGMTRESLEQMLKMLNT